MNHQKIDERSLAFGRMMAERLKDNPSLIQRARDNLGRWMAACSPRTLATLAEWKQALEGPVEGIIHLLTATDERSTRLRQSNPFAGVLTMQERNAVIRQFQHHASPGA
jgi:hypothetical protein